MPEISPRLYIPQIAAITMLALPMLGARGGGTWTPPGPVTRTATGDRSWRSGHEALLPASYGWGSRGDAAFAEIYRFPLRATSRARGARGEGRLHLAWSPFGIAATRDGHLVYELELAVTRLRPPSTLGGYKAYVAWMVTPALDRVERLGTIGSSGKLTARVSTMNKFILIITAEPSAEAEKRSGPIVLRGVSPSGLLQSFAGHEMFSNMPHPE